MRNVLTGTIDVAGILGEFANTRRLLPGEIQTIVRDVATQFISSSGTTPGIIQLTPPFSASGPALMAGKRSIDRDLGGIFVPVTLKGRRKVTQMFGHLLKKPVFVATRELYPNVGQIYEYRKTRQVTMGRKLLSRGRRQPFYVDRQKLDLLRRELYTRIGWAAAAWYAAALAAGLNPKGVPEWVRSKTAAPGSATLQIGPTSFSILISSMTKYNEALGMRRKVASVCEYRENALRRSLPYQVNAMLKKAGLDTA